MYDHQHFHTVHIELPTWLFRVEKHHVKWRDIFAATSMKKKVAKLRYSTCIKTRTWSASEARTNRRGCTVGTLTNCLLKHSLRFEPPKVTTHKRYLISDFSTTHRHRHDFWSSRSPFFLFSGDICRQFRSELRNLTILQRLRGGRYFFLALALFAANFFSNCCALKTPRAHLPAPAMPA